jgi:hypothetical protein
MAAFWDATMCGLAEVDGRCTGAVRHDQHGDVIMFEATVHDTAL